jgi:hypothetical protein
MENMGQIEICVSGLDENTELRPDNYDINDTMAILKCAEDLLCPEGNHSRPLISYSILPGSVRHVFTTSEERVAEFNATIGQVNQSGNIDSLTSRMALAIETLQDVSMKKGYAFDISTSLNNSNRVRLDANTSFRRREDAWVDAEFYFYGKITDAGGKDKANIHVLTNELGLIHVQTPIDFLEQYESNILYKVMGIQATGKQHAHTGKIDPSSLKFLRLIDYQPEYDENYLNGLKERVRQSWPSSFDADSWLNEIRGRT